MGMERQLRMAPGLDIRWDDSTRKNRDGRWCSASAIYGARSKVGHGLQIVSMVLGKGTRRTKRLLHDGPSDMYSDGPGMTCCR